MATVNKTIISVTVDNKLLEEIETFRFNERMTNRSKAFEKLIEYGFQHYKENIEKEKKNEDFSLIQGIEELIKQYKGR